MKPRNKEVNIFNMSLLDILCGALGAFCFMMLVLFQYWKPEGPETKQVKVDTAQLEQKLKDALNQMKNMSNVPPEVAQRLRQMEKDFTALQEQLAKLRALLEKAQAQAEAFRRQAAEAEGRVQSAESEAAQLRKENTQLRTRNPIVISMITQTANHHVDLYVKDSKMDEPDPFKVQGKKWNGDVYYNPLKGPATDVWLMRDAPAQEYKIYYKFLDREGNTEPARILGYFMHHNGWSVLPTIQMTEDKKVAYVGSIWVNKDYSSDFKVAPEYAKAYQELLDSMKQRGGPYSTGQKPSAPPAATPPPAAAPKP